MALIFFLVPLFSAPLISSEIESRHLDLLRLSRLSSLGIVVGKLESVVVLVSILLVATLPALLALGHVQKELVVPIKHCSATLLATVLFLSSAGVFFSSLSRKSSTSIAATYVTAVVICVLSLIGVLAPDRFSEPALARVFVVNPVVTVLRESAATQDSPAMLQALRERFDLWLPNLRFLLVSTVVLLALTVARVRALMRPD